MMSVEFGGTVTRVWYRLYSSVDDPRSYEPAGSSAVTVSVVPRIQSSPVPPPPVAVPPLLSLLPPHAARATASAPAPATATSLCRITSHPLVVLRCANARPHSDRARSSGEHSPCPGRGPSPPGPAEVAIAQRLPRSDGRDQAQIGSTDSAESPTRESVKSRRGPGGTVTWRGAQ